MVLTCAGCGTAVDDDARCPWRCPRASSADPYHVLVPPPAGAIAGDDDPNPFLRYIDRLAALRVAAVGGMAAEERVALVRRMDAAVATVEGHGFRTTPLWRSETLSDELGFDVWVKDETGGVAGSHKGRHLASILLHLLAVEALDGDRGRGVAARAPLAIASCGNAALAAATLAAAVAWPLRVFVPVHADPWVLERLEALGAVVVTCPRRTDDPPGDPCLHRFRAAVAAGAVPFTVQGPENGLCLDGGRTLGWEAAEQLAAAGVAPTRLYVQVGGGALATCATAGLADGGCVPRLFAVQTEGCAPLARAWARSRGFGTGAAGRWTECMWPWEDEPRSAASGILDDETYDWVTVVSWMERTGGGPVVVPETLVGEAVALARRTTGIDVSATGAAGLAGVLDDHGQIGPGERVLVVFTGHR